MIPKIESTRFVYGELPKQNLTTKKKKKDSSKKKFEEEYEEVKKSNNTDFINKVVQTDILW